MNRTLGSNDRSSVFALHAMEVAPMDWSRRMKPGEIEHGVRAVRLRMTQRIRSLTEMLIDVADMPDVTMRPRKSLLAIRIARPQHRMRASVFVERHITEK
jgi:hypothetical protein